MRARIATAMALAVLTAGACAVDDGGDRVVTASDDGALVDAPSAPDAPSRDRGVGGDRPRTGVRPVLAPPSNIVLVLMDDFSLDLLPTMRNARRMSRQGATYRHAYVVDSLCCVSRASLLTGQYPHQTGVLTNTANTPNAYGPIGGWEAYAAHGNAERSVNVALQERGYTTGFVGKFLNQYEARDGNPPPVLPGWDELRVIFGGAYDGWGFQSSRLEDGRLEIETHDAPWLLAGDEEKDAAHVGTVTEEMALEFIEDHAAEKAPYFLEVAPYAPHGRVGKVGAYPGDPFFPPQFRDRPGTRTAWGNCGAVHCRDLTVRDLSGFGDDPADNAPRREDGSAAPSWRGEAPRMPATSAERALRNRARMVASIDRMLGRILDSVDEDTYVVLTSDNGFHLGQHGLGAGKGTPYDSDVHVPLVVTGPGVVRGVRDEVVSNIDLAPTFEEIAGLEPAAYRSGTSLVPTFGDTGVDRRDVMFVEHTWAPSLGFDPDRSYSGGTIDRIPSYVAARSRTGLLVRVDLDPDWEDEEIAWEYYDYRDADHERTNSVADPSKQKAVGRLRARLEEFLACRSLRGDDRVPARCRALTRAG